MLSKLPFLVFVFFTINLNTTKAQSLQVFSEKKDGETKYGLKNISGEIIVKPINRTIEVCKQYDTYLLSGSKESSIVNNKGKVVYGPFDAYRGEFSNGVIAVFFDSKHVQALVTSAGKEYYQQKGDKYTEFKLDIIKNSKVGRIYMALIDTLGNIVIGLESEYGFSGNQNFIWARDQSTHKLVVLNRDGTKVDHNFLKLEALRTENESILSKNLLIAYCNDTTFGIINPAFKEILPCRFSRLYLSDTLLELTDGKTKLKGIYTLEGKELIPPVYESITFFRNKFYCTRNGKKGVLNFDGSVRKPFEFDEINTYLGNAKASYVRKGELWGLWDLEENIMLDFEYTLIKDFDESNFIIRKNGLSGLFNRYTKEKNRL